MNLRRALHGRRHVAGSLGSLKSFRRKEKGKLDVFMWVNGELSKSITFKIYLPPADEPAGAGDLGFIFFS